MNDVILNKKESIELCIKQIREYYNLASDKPFKEDHFKQDAIAINLQSACEQAIAMANHIIKNEKLGLPKESRESFQLLFKTNIISEELWTKLHAMVGFRNILVHQYQKVDFNLMIDIIENHLDDLINFTVKVMEHLK